MLVLKYHLTEEEYLDYNIFTAWTSPDKKSYRIKYYAQVLILYIAVAGLYIFANRSHTLVIDFTIFFIIGLLYFLLVPYLVRRSIRTKVRSILTQPENQHVLNETEVIISDAGIIDRDTIAESRYGWDAIVRKTETRLCYYLYTSSYHAIVIPKRIVREQDQRQLETLFDMYLPLSSHFNQYK